MKFTDTFITQLVEEGLVVDFNQYWNLITEHIRRDILDRSAPLHDTTDDHITITTSGDTSLLESQMFNYNDGWLYT